MRHFDGLESSERNRLFLREPPLRSLTLVAPFVNTMQDCRYSLADLSAKIKAQRIPTYFVTRKPDETWQEEAVALLARNELIEIRFNESLHARFSSPLPFRNPNRSPFSAREISPARRSTPISKSA